MRRVMTILVAGLLVAGPAHAGIFRKSAAPPAAPSISDATLVEIQRAVDEQRLTDAGRYLDQALVAGVKDPRLTLLGADLNLAKGRYEFALAGYRAVEATPSLTSRSLQGQGITLAMLSRSDEALKILQRVTALDATAWRAWNALGREYDHRGRWSDAEAAYAAAMAASDGSPLVLNNRGYSRLLQQRRDDAVADLVAALRKRPDLVEARTNLRLALALNGDYDRAMAGGSPDDTAALLNNAGFAAGMRGDYAKAEELLGQAMVSRGEFYGRAAENLKVVRALANQNRSPSNVPD